MGILSWKLTRREMIKLAAAGAAGTGLMGMAGCQPSQPAPSATSAGGQPAGQAAGAPVQGGVLRYANAAEAVTLDPNVGNLRFDAKTIYQIFDCLVFMDQAGKVYPWLATEWQASPDAKTWTFKLRQDVKFHDGTPFNADAVKYNFDRMVDPATKSRNAAVMMGPYDGTEVVDPYTVRVRFTRANAPFPYLITSVFGGMVSPTAAKKAGVAAFGNAPVGSGPFRFKEWVLKDHITLERNPDYNWGHGAMKHKGSPYLDQIVIVPIADGPSRVAALESGQVDIADNLPTSDVARLKADPKYTIVANSVIGMAPQGHINVEKFPTDDILVRQAILYGHSSEEISKVAWDGAYKSAYSVLSRADRFYDQSVEKMYPQDKAKAESLLQQAGWKKGSDGLHAKDGKPLQILFIVMPPYVAAAEAFQVQMAAIGIKTDIRQALAPAVDQMRQSGEHNVAWNGTQQADPSGLRRNFATSSIGTSQNFNRYRGKEIDELLEAGDAELDNAKRTKIYSDFQKIILDKALAVPLYEGTQIFGMRSQVQGFAVQVVAEFPILYDVWLKK